MRLGRPDLDRMAHLADVKPVRRQRVIGEGFEIARRRGRRAARHPAGDAADHKSHDRGDCGCGGNAAPAASAVADHLVEREAFGNRFVRGRAVARADRIGLRAPGGDHGRVLGMRREPGVHRTLPVGRQFTVDEGVQLVRRDGSIVRSHCFTFSFHAAQRRALAVEIGFDLGSRARKP
jgi:hypothetical protein